MGCYESRHWAVILRCFGLSAISSVMAEQSCVTFSHSRGRLGVGSGLVEIAELAGREVRMAGWATVEIPVCRMRSGGEFGDTG